MQSTPVFRPERYEVNQDFMIRVSLRRLAGRQPQVVEARLTGLSAGGAMLSCKQPLESHEIVELTLDADELKLHLFASATVAWTRQTKDGSYTLGCTLDPPLIPDALEQLLANGLLERRRSPRVSVRAQALATWDENSTEQQVGLLDLATGGFSLLAPIPAHHGSPLRLRVERPAGHEPLLVEAAVRWQMLTESGYVIGCTFAEPASFALLKKHLLPAPLLDFGGKSSGRMLALLSSVCAVLGALYYWRWMMGAG